MFKPNKQNIEYIKKALNDDAIAFQKLVVLLKISPKLIKATLVNINSKIEEKSNNEHITKEEALNYYINDLLNNKVKLN